MNNLGMKIIDYNSSLNMNIAQIDNKSSEIKIRNNKIDINTYIRGGSTPSILIYGNNIEDQILDVFTNVDTDTVDGSITYTWSNSKVGPFIKLDQADVGKTITVTGTYTDTSGNIQSLTSSATDPIVNINDAPTGTVTISGSAIKGSILDVSNSIQDEDGLQTATITYQ